MAELLSTLNIISIPGHQEITLLLRAQRSFYKNSMMVFKVGYP